MDGMVFSACEPLRPPAAPQLRLVVGGFCSSQQLRRGTMWST
jgi:hypothetical protein